MIKTLLIILIGCSICLPLFAQKKNEVKHDTIAYYMRNDHEMANSENDAKSLRLIIKEKNGLYRIEDYYLDAKPKLLAESTINSIDFETGTQGERIDYYPNGNIKTIAQYDKGYLIGDKESNYLNGNLYTITSRVANAEYLMKYVDTVGNVLADNGNGKWVDFDGDFVSKKEGPVINGKREGDWVETAATGKKRNGTFKNGILVSGPLLTDDDNTYGKVDVPPSFVGGEQAFSKFLSRTLKYPQVAKDENIQGLVVITFVVEKDGTLTNINVLRAPHVSMAKEATRVLALSPAWKPGIQNGKPVRVQYSLPITFGLEVSTFIPGKSSDGYSSDDRY